MTKGKTQGARGNCVHTPKEDGFFFPAEHGRHLATVMIWPERGGSWIYGARHARPVFAGIIRKISAAEHVFLCVSESGLSSAKELLEEEIAIGRVTLMDIPTDDCWARDMAPTFLTDGKEVRGVDWTFNAWGGGYDGLYAHWEQDDAFASRFCERIGFRRYEARPFVLEGGSIHTDGAGTLLATEECLLSPGRNPSMTKEEIERVLCDFTGADRVIWLPYGVCGDETDGHVDNICAFTGTGEAVLAWTDEPGEQHRRCLADLAVLEEAGIRVKKIPFPAEPVAFTRYETDGFTYEPGEAVRTVGEVLAASYVNFYVCNAGVLVPQFGDRNDAGALRVLAEAFPGREIIPVYARDLIVGGGNIHCLTQQIPDPAATVAKEKSGGRRDF